MESPKSVKSPYIKAINKEAVHRICSGQVNIKLPKSYGFIINTVLVLVYLYLGYSGTWTGNIDKISN